jgi:hypothetical protein
MTSFRTPTRFYFLNKKINFCFYIAECANIVEFANIAEIFRQKTFGDICPPVKFQFEFKYELKYEIFQSNVEEVKFPKYTLKHKHKFSNV